ncbi:MAG: protein arginine kinase [Oscillospiraceae bacterium]|nr:protein arginine kinase [Oscillospiraceae bacterium]
MLWYKENNSGTAQSTRIRLARNIRNTPFPQKLDDNEKRELTEKIKNAVMNGNSALAKNFSYIGMNEISENEKLILCEKHLISREMAASRNGGVITDKDENISIMIMEEDHIRIQIIKSGLCLDEAYGIADKVDDVINESLGYAYDEEFGYLTSCPTNTGTGMRASVMLHLPALVMTGRIDSIINSANQLGITVRGLYGEGSKGAGALYQFSNRVTLGAGETEICGKLGSIVNQIIDKEKAAREYIGKEMPNSLDDVVWRSYGILKYARSISSDEAKKLLSDVKLGIDMGIINVSGINTAELSVITEPGFIMSSAGNISPAERDRKRSEIIREALNK